MAYYSDDWLDEVRLRSDIVEIVSEHVMLRQSGRRYTGLCPFHKEKTPSFSVNAEGQFYYCFGCHRGGNVFRFVMETEHMEFPEAVRYLAERAHIAIPENGRTSQGFVRERKDRLYTVLTEAARWYYAQLYAPEGCATLQYLHERGLGDNTIRRFGLGASGKAWDALTKAFQKAGITREELEEANLSIAKGDRIFDMFRSRAMFPIFDQRGKVVAFGGRILGDGQPKYLNSSDTPVFNKRRTLYGLNFIKGSVNKLYLVEGYMDVVSLAQHGINGCVATLGTAITPEQARLIRRRTGESGEVVIVYDGDDAGQRATRRAIDIFAMEDVRCKVVVIPGGKDPDDFVRVNGKQAFLQMKSQTSIEYLLEWERRAVDLGTLEGRTAYATAAAKILKTLDNAVEIDNYVKILGVETGFSRDVLYEQIGRSPKMRLTARFSENAEPQRKKADEDRQLSDCVKAQRRLLALLAARGGELRVPIALDVFTDPLCAEIAAILLPALGEPIIVSRLLDNVEDDEKRAQIAGILALEDDVGINKLEEVIAGYLRTISLQSLESELIELAKRMEGKHPSDVPELFGQYMKISEKLRNLKSRQSISAPL